MLEIERPIVLKHGEMSCKQLLLLPESVLRGAEKTPLQRVAYIIYCTSPLG